MGNTNYKVKAGDCITSIAAAYRLPWDKIWNLGDNANLKQNRGDPNALAAGDVVVVPDIVVKEETRGSDASYTFKLKQSSASIAVRFMIEDEPKKNRPFKLYVDGKLVKSGNTDGSGYVKAPIPPDAQVGRIVITEEDNTQGVYAFTFGTVGALDTDDGIKARLADLGFDVSDDDLSKPISAFQSKNKLQVTGAVNDETKNKLKELFGQ